LYGIENRCVTPNLAFLYGTEMTDDRKTGIALIVGSVAGVITMAIHPTIAGKLSPDQLGYVVRTSGIAHTLALASVFLLFLGACGLTRKLAAPDRIAISALVTFAFSCVAIMIAATISGWVVPGILKLMARDSPANAVPWQIAMGSIFQINQAMSKVYSVGAALAIILWSTCSLFVPDVFGLNRRTVESFRAEKEQARFALAATHITLSSNVVEAAIQEASLRAQIDATRQLIEINTHMLDVLRKQFEKGYVGRLDVAAQEAQLAQVAATLPPLLKQLAQNRDLLIALSGRLPTRTWLRRLNFRACSYARNYRSVSRRNSSSSVQTSAKPRRTCILRVL
jgi:Outer membrane efflux protein